MHSKRICLISVFQFFVFMIMALVLVAGAHANDATASSLARNSSAALAQGRPVRDVTITGTVSWMGGPETETGTISLSALGISHSRIDLMLPSGTRTEIRDVQNGIRTGKWINPDGSSGPFAGHNCQADAVWFFPAFSSLVTKQNVVLSYLGQETRGEATVEHVRSFVYEAGARPNKLSQPLGTMDFYLDSATLLPVAVTFNEHPDDDATTDFLVEVVFSDYRIMNGVLMPTHIQRYSQGSLLMDITVTGASFNTGLRLSDFNAN